MYCKINTIYDIKELDENERKNISKPYLIKGGCKKMNVFSESNKLEYLKNEFGKIKFPVELYETKELMGETEIRNIKEKKFSMIFDKISSDSKPYWYMAEVELKDYVDNEIIENKFNLEIDKERENDGVLMFFGNSGKSGCHLHTGNDYILNQIVGRKNVYMFNYNDNDVEFRSIFSDRSNFIKKNFFTMDHSKMKIYKVELEEGDSLMIPPWWWHAVEGIGLNCSITKTYERSDYSYVYDKPNLAFVMIVAGFLDFFEDSFEIIVTTIIIIILLLLYQLYNLYKNPNIT